MTRKGGWGKWRPFEEAREYAGSLGLKSARAWQEWSKSGERPADIPSDPADTKAYKEEWRGWGDWLGTGRARARRRPFEEAREYAHGLGLKGKAQWQEWSKSGARPPDIPSPYSRSY